MSKITIILENAKSNEDLQSKLTSVQKLINIGSSSTYIQIGKDVTVKIESEKQ